jgi:hypothetical protein
MHEELVRRETRALATPEEARRANTELRLHMRELQNYRADLEELAENLVRSVGHTSTGALTHREVALMAAKLGLEIVHVGDLPSQCEECDRSGKWPHLPAPGVHPWWPRVAVTRPAGDRPPGAQAQRARYVRGVFATAPRHQLLCCRLLDARGAGAGLSLQQSQEKNLAVEDFRDAFGVTHEAAGLRFMNLATKHLGLPCTFSGSAMTVLSTRPTKMMASPFR